MKKIKILSKAILAAGLITTGVAGMASQSLPVNAMANAIVAQPEFGVECVAPASTQPEVLKYVFDHDFDRDFGQPANYDNARQGMRNNRFDFDNGNGNGYGKRASGEVGRSSSRDNQDRMTVDEYSQKLELLNAKYDHMFRIKSEMDSMETKHQQYWVLQAAYQKELKDLTNEWAGTAQDSVASIISEWRGHLRDKKMRQDRGDNNMSNNQNNQNNTSKNSNQQRLVDTQDAMQGRDSQQDNSQANNSNSQVGAGTRDMRQSNNRTGTRDRQNADRMNGSRQAYNRRGDNYRQTNGDNRAERMNGNRNGRLDRQNNVSNANANTPAKSRDRDATVRKEPNNINNNNTNNNTNPNNNNNNNLQNQNQNNTQQTR